MRSTLTNIKATKILAALAAMVFGLGMVSCSSDEPDQPADVSEAKVSFTFTIPDGLFRYTDITVVHNNDAGNDTEWYPMEENTTTVDYDITKFPVTAPVVLVYDLSNRLVSGINVDWELKMDVCVTETVNGKEVVRNESYTYPLKGDLFTALYNLSNHSIDRTYGVRISPDGQIEFIHPEI